MEFYEVVANRRTVRDWTQEDVDEETLKRILNAGLQAPSNDHMRDWAFIVLRSREEKENALRFVKAWAEKQSESKAAMPNGTPAQRMYAYATPRQYTMLLNAPYVILPAFRARINVFRAEFVNQLNPFASIWCVIENLFLAASAEGLACSLRIPVGEEREQVSVLLRVPTDYIIPCYIGIGHAADGASKLEQHTCTAEQTIHYGQW